MAVARSIFTLDGEFKLFCAAFDLPITVVPLKVALGLGILIFGHLKNNQKNSPGYTCVIIFCNAQKSISPS